MSGATTVTIGSQRYEFLNTRVSEQKHGSFAQADPYGPTVLIWNRAELLKAMPSFVDNSEGVSYGFSVMISPDFDGNLDLKLNSYFLRDEFLGASVEFDEALKMYRVRRKIDRDRWDLLKIRPGSRSEAIRSIDEFWVADCAKPVGFSHALCRMETQYRGNNISVNVLAENMGIRNEVISFIRRELDVAYRGAAETKSK